MTSKPIGRIVLMLVASCLLMGLFDDCDPEAVCISAADVAAKTGVRCEPESTYEQQRQAFIDKVALGDCKTIKKIRDAKSFIYDCLPWLEKAPCHILQSGQKLPACENQLLFQDAPR